MSTNNNLPTAKAKRLTILDKDIAIQARELAGMDMYEVRCIISDTGKNAWSYLTAGSVNKQSKDVIHEFEMVKEIINKALAEVFGKGEGDVPQPAPKTALDQIEKLINELTIVDDRLK